MIRRTVNRAGHMAQTVIVRTLFAISRQAIINDDIRVFTRMPQKMGQLRFPLRPTV